MIYIVKKFKHYFLGNSFIFWGRSLGIIVFGEQTNSNRSNCQMTLSITKVIYKPS